MLFSFEEIINPSTKITYDKVIESHNLDIAKRICFNSCHKNALKKKTFKDIKWVLNVPFEESIGKILKKETGFSLIRTKYGFWYPMKERLEYDEMLKFKEKYNEIVFLRDNLDISVALSEHFNSEGERTALGELEFQAKWHSCSKSRIKIADRVIDFINSTPHYKDCLHVCSIPSSKLGKVNLPMKIAGRIALKCGVTDISSSVNWASEKSQLKELSFLERWDALETTGIEINLESNPKSVILIDDLYQSGTTLQYVAMKLKESGIKKVYGLTIVKARKDSDNS